MTDNIADLVAEIEALLASPQEHPALSERLHREAAQAITSLRIESSKFAHGMDKAKLERDAAERRSEAFWKAQLAAAEARAQAAEAERDRLTLEIEAARMFGGGFFAENVKETTRDVYRQSASEALGETK